MLIELKCMCLSDCCCWHWPQWIAVALSSRWEEGHKALNCHVWLLLQESVARTERVKKTTWWPETASALTWSPTHNTPQGLWKAAGAARRKSWFPHHNPKHSEPLEKLISDHWPMSTQNSTSHHSSPPLHELHLHWMPSVSKPHKVQLTQWTQITEKRLWKHC